MPSNAPMVLLGSSGEDLEKGEATPASSDDDDSSLMMRSHACCGCCCDCRMAVIVIDVICLVFAGLSILAGSPVAIVTGFFMGIGIYGAVNYNSTAVAIAGFTHLALFVFGLVRIPDTGMIPIDILFAYPHVVLFNEINNGITTKATYRYERRCCC